MKAGLTSAFQIAAIPESTFLKKHGKALGTDVARQIHINAVDSQIRNEHALMTMRETAKGSGLAIIDGHQTREARVAMLQKVVDAKAVPLNLSTLFGSLDYCECDDCLSVYSPASYLVELFQFLRNNDLGPDPATGSATNKNIHPGIVGTPLEKLFRRRPDLGCLQLTCENTFTVLPYVDLANEVMESFVVHLDAYEKDAHVPKQATLEAFNVEGEASSELLAIPQHVNYQAYCILKSAVYPFTLPYHQPIDATRIFLDYLGTSREELLDVFRTPTEHLGGVSFTPAETIELAALHQTVVERAVDAEGLGMTQEEYIILTREAFWPKRYFDLTQSKTFSTADYEANIGVRQVCEYYGYVAPAKGTCDTDMLDLAEATQVGLTFVKKQLLRRTGVSYVELVDLLKTRFINPALPQGEALAMLESIRFSYRFLQTLVDAGSKDPKIRFAQLIAFLESKQATLPLVLARLHPDLCRQQAQDPCSDERANFRAWVHCYFDRIGKLIVLESGEGPHLPIAGDVFAGSRFVGRMSDQGIIRDKRDAIVGRITATGTAVNRDGKLLVDGFADEIVIKDDAGTVVGFIRKSGLQGLRENPLGWIPARDTCDLDKVRLVHLDGSALTVDEYDRMQRFIRLWRRTAWAIDDLDAALTNVAFSAKSPKAAGGAPAQGGATPQGQPPGTASEDPVGFDAFVDVCAPGTADPRCGPVADPGAIGRCPDPKVVPDRVTPAFLHELRAIRRLVERTGLPLQKLLTFWSDIGIDGDKPLYRKLFLTHNLLGIDHVFAADLHGNYLTRTATIADHLPVLMAALRIKADDIAALMRIVPVGDSLTLHNVSALYRFAVLAKLLNVRIPALANVVALFGDPFASPWATVAFLETWGSMEDAGFTIRQLAYVVLDRDDPARPLAPSQRTILQVAKTLFDGLNGIDRDHPDLPAGSTAGATSDLVRAKTGLLFDATVVEQIMGLLEGTTVYTTNAPVALKISIPSADPLQSRIKYSQQSTTPATASIQVVGILTASDTTRAKALSGHPKWDAAIDRIGKQAKNVFNDALVGIFTNPVEATKHLLAGDFANPTDPEDAANTAPQKRLYFLQQFLPFLRERLSQRLVTATCAGTAGLSTEMTEQLLKDILLIGSPPVAAMEVLEALKERPTGAPAGWDGYLIPSADGEFTFVAIGDTQPPALVLDGREIAFAIQQEDPSNVWSSDPTTAVGLKSGKLYRLTVADRSAEDILWRTPASPGTRIPSASLLPDFSSKAAGDVVVELRKAALLIDGFAMGVDEVAWFQRHPLDFDGFDFNAPTLQGWKRLQAYVDLRDSLPATGATLLNLFHWASDPTADPDRLAERIAAVTGWDQVSLDRLLAPNKADAHDHFDLTRPEAFRNEVALLKLRPRAGDGCEDRHRRGPTLRLGQAGLQVLGLSHDRRGHPEGDARALRSGRLGAGRQAAERSTARASEDRADRLPAGPA